MGNKKEAESPAESELVKILRGGKQVLAVEPAFFESEWIPSMCILSGREDAEPTEFAVTRFSAFNYLLFFLGGALVAQGTVRGLGFEPALRWGMVLAGFLVLILQGVYNTLLYGYRGLFIFTTERMDILLPISKKGRRLHELVFYLWFLPLFIGAVGGIVVPIWLDWDGAKLGQYVIVASVIGLVITLVGQALHTRASVEMRWGTDGLISIYFCSKTEKIFKTYTKAYKSFKSGKSKKRSSSSTDRSSAISAEGDLIP